MNFLILLLLILWRELVFSSENKLFCNLCPSNRSRIDALACVILISIARVAQAFIPSDPIYLAFLPGVLSFEHLRAYPPANVDV